MLGKEGKRLVGCAGDCPRHRPESLLALLVNRVRNLGPRPEFAWADQIKKNTAKQFRDAVAENVSCSDWFAAFGTDLGLSEDQTLQSTDLDMTGGQQKFLLKLRDASSAISASDLGAEALLREALFGPWQYKPSKKASDLENSHSLGIDPSTLLQGAFTAQEPAGIKDKRGVRGAIWLAFESLPLFPCAMSGGRLRTASFCRGAPRTQMEALFRMGSVGATPEPSCR